jgi:hypothetical protein
MTRNVIKVNPIYKKARSIFQIKLKIINTSLMVFFHEYIQLMVII